MSEYEDAKATTARTAASASTPGTSGGLFDGLSFPPRLTARVVDPHGLERAIAGYDVESGLAATRGFLETAWLALTGELPTAGEHAALSCALTLLAPVHVGESPVHAAVVARVAACADEVLGGIAATAAGLFAKAELAAVPALTAALDGAGAVPSVFAIEADEPHAGAARDRYVALCARSAAWFAEPLPLELALNRVGSAYALLLRLGQHAPLALVAWTTLARLPVVFAEAARTAPGSVTQYPTRTPDYVYVEAP